MTQENFEKYLALLKGLLKLGDSQKEEIASELRDHLEQRVEELKTKGVSSKEAELIAIKEFGDAAGMASSFVNISRFRKQRWLMRFTTFAIAGCFVITVFLMSMWPQNGPVPIKSANAETNPTLTTDQELTADTGSNVFSQEIDGEEKQGAVSKTRSAAEKNAYAAIEKTIPQLSLIESPLSEVLVELSEKANASILINKDYIEDSGLTFDEPITLQIKEAKLSTILSMVLGDQLGLDDWVYGVKDSFIYISSEDQSQELMEVRVYDCSDFAITATYRVPLQTSGLGGTATGGMATGGGGLGGGGLGGGGLGGGGGGFFNFAASPITQGLGGGFGGASGTGSDSPNQPNPQIIEGGRQQVQTKSTNKEKPGANPTLGYKTFQTQDLSELIDCVQTTIAPDNWESMGGVATLSQVGTSLVVNQTIENHRKIEELLVMLRKVKSMKKQL